MIRLEGNDIYLDEYREDIIAQLDRVYERVSGELHWKRNGLPWYNKIYSFAKAIASGEAKAQIVEKRKQSCATCPMLDKTPEGDYCKACGCGRWPPARLDKKLTYDYVECPLRRPGFSNEKTP